MSERSDALVERVAEWFRVVRYRHERTKRSTEMVTQLDREASARVLRAIVDELGITRGDVTMLRDAAMEWQTHSNPHGHLGLQELADRITALLEATYDE